MVWYYSLVLEISTPKSNCFLKPKRQVDSPRKPLFSTIFSLCSLGLKMFVMFLESWDFSQLFLWFRQKPSAKQNLTKGEMYAYN